MEALTHGPCYPTHHSYHWLNVLEYKKVERKKERERERKSNFQSTKPFEDGWMRVNYII